MKATLRFITAIGALLALTTPAAAQESSTLARSPESSTAAAPAAVTISSYKITSDMPASGTPADGPSTFQAGANPNAGSYSTFTYPNGSEDIRTAITNFAAGLLGNPESVPKCPQSALEAGGAACPAGSLIGTSRLDTALGPWV